jgi:hypothetical protein
MEDEVTTFGPATEMWLAILIAPLLELFDFLSRLFSWVRD